MIQPLAVSTNDRKRIFVLWQQLVGGVGLDQQAVRRNVFESFALTQLAFVKKVAGKTEIRAEPGKGPGSSPPAHRNCAAQSRAPDADDRAAIRAAGPTPANSECSPAGCARRRGRAAREKPPPDRRKANPASSGLGRFRRRRWARRQENAPDFSARPACVRRDATGDSRSWAARFYFPAPARTPAASRFHRRR